MPSMRIKPLIGRTRIEAFAAAAAFLLALPLTAGAFEFGSGIERTETRMPGKFTKIEASGSTILDVTAGHSATLVVVSGDDNIVPLVRTTVVGDVLKIKTEGRHSTKLPLVVKVTMPKLVAIAASGASKISAANLSGERFKLEGSGSTKATVGGAVETLVISLSGAGQVDAAALAAKNAEIDTSGAGKVDINASDKLQVSISGAGIVTYLGNPVVSRSISGAGKIIAKK